MNIESSLANIYFYVEINKIFNRRNEIHVAVLGMAFRHDVPLLLLLLLLLING